MITTEGYRDILHIARHKKPLNFSNYQDLPWQRYPLVRRRYRLTVPERIDDGRRRCSSRSTRRRRASRCAQLKEAGVEAVAVCFLFSFLNAAHERRVAEIVREEFPEAFLSVSLGGAAAVPRVRALLDRLPERVRRPEGRELRAPPRGRAARARRAHRRPPDDLRERRGDRARRRSRGRSTCSCRARSPASSAASGPAGRPGFENVITLDVGGTSADIGLAQDGQPAHEAPARHEGRPLPGDDPDGRRRHDRRRRRLDRLRRPGRHLPRRPAVGRRRSRARPRYGRGGTEPTATDAHGQPRLALAGGVPRRRHGARRRARAHGVRGRAGAGARHVASRRRRWAPSRS